MLEWFKNLSRTFQNDGLFSTLFDFKKVRDLFKKKPKTRLGIDLGSSTIKLVEISSLPAGGLKLETYGLAYLANEYTEDLSNKEIAQVIRELISQAKVKTNIAYFSLPVFATFSTLIDLPVMSKEELAAAIPYEAKKYIPVPLEEVALDWSVITADQTADQLRGSNADQDQRKSVLKISDRSAGIQVILVAILKEVIEKYTKISQMANLEIRFLEAESFSLARSLVGQAQGSFILIDIGSRFTDITLVKDGSVRVIHNAKKVISPIRSQTGNTFSRLPENMESVYPSSISELTSNGVDQKTGQLNKESLVQEVERVINLYRAKYNHLENIKCILTGRGALTTSLVDYLKEKFNFEVLIGNPFSQVAYPEILEPVLKEIGPSLSVAVGLAMRE